MVEGTGTVALGVVDAALEMAEAVFAGYGDMAEGRGLGESPGFLETILPELGFGDEEAAEEPVVANEGVEPEALFGRSRLPMVVIFGGEGGEVIGVFTADDEGLGMNPGFQSIHGRRGLAFEGTGAGRFLRIEAVGLDLFEGGHKRKGQKGD